MIAKIEIIKLGIYRPIWRILLLKHALIIIPRPVFPLMIPFPVSIVHLTAVA